MKRMQAYPSENGNARDRAVRRVDKMQQRLDWPQGIFEGSGWGLPKNMHRRTYARIVREYARIEADALRVMMGLLRRAT